MAIWLVRAGKGGARESWALEKDEVIIGWDGMPDLSQFKDKDQMLDKLKEVYPDKKIQALYNHRSQLWAFAKRIVKGDLVVLPLKSQDAIAVGEVTGDYNYRPDNPSFTKHARGVKWIKQDIPRSRFDQDLLYSLGAFMTVCQIKRNNAEERIKAIVKGGKLPPATGFEDDEDVSNEDGIKNVNIEDYASTQIRSYIAQKFTGHQLADLINAILEAQGYVTEVSPPGPDGGVDIIAGRGPMGFDPPWLACQVKSGNNQQDVKVMRELKGVMQEFKAEQGLFVSWGGFTREAIKEARKNFFELRLWDAGEVVENLLGYYEKFADEIKADLPLKRVWLLVQEDDEI
ncbi:Restriction endonuclease [Sedimentisphaera cyanobacteriorum]|uniref:Restriction endonuclease n=1 Tax=Sedimentisphaera cyanobacteriorum TaxID=1940790 RepID=A0A1Q2HS14_9BACT|nr:restriction endonuclease [Sedimentisphaera cyanobacteriorum]AQQ10064.1 Restriction endonuclease [Sedimentisphaera cyanobacteriorum]